MKILHIVESLDNSYGGPAKSVPMLVKYLDKLNCENKIFTVRVHENEQNSVLDENNIEFVKVPLRGIKKIKYSPFTNLLSLNSNIVYIFPNRLL